jgi:hypothetical protein
VTAAPVPRIRPPSPLGPTPLDPAQHCTAFHCTALHCTRPVIISRLPNHKLGTYRVQKIQVERRLLKLSDLDKVVTTFCHPRVLGNLTEVEINFPISEFPHVPPSTQQSRHMSRARSQNARFRLWSDLTFQPQSSSRHQSHSFLGPSTATVDIFGLLPDVAYPPVNTGVSELTSYTAMQSGVQTVQRDYFSGQKYH